MQGGCKKGDTKMEKSMKQFIKNTWFFVCASPTRFFFKIRNANVEKNVEIRGKIDFIGTGKVTIGEGTVINSSHRANPSGGNRTTFYVLPGANLEIGKKTGLSNVTVCCSDKVIIGNYVTVGAGCSIYDTDFHPLSYTDRRNRNDRAKTSIVIIEDDVFIGAHSIILKGSHIGARSIIGAGSVVAGNIPNDEVWAGNPCRFIRKINGDKK